MGSDGDTFDGDLLCPSPELFKLDTTNGPCEGSVLCHEIENSVKSVPQLA